MAERKDNLYNEKSIESLSPLEFTRLRPGVYAGNTTYSTQLLVEVFSNAVDEFRAGHGNQIDVEIKKDIVSVRDYGQGFLVNALREDGKTILEAAFSVLNTSGKYRDDGSYEGTSLGSFGIGSKITTFLSNWLEVKTWRDNKTEFIRFNEGVFEERKVEDCKVDETLQGTLVKWKPSKAFFENSIVEIGKVKTLFKTMACLCPGLIINLNDNGEKSVFKSENGLNDLADDAIKDKELLKNRLNLNYIDNKYKLDLVMTYTTDYSSTFISYVNAGLVEVSPILTQIKSVLTKELNKFFRDKGWLKEKEDNLTSDDIQEGMYMVFNATVPSVSYDSQVKTRVVAMDCKPQISAFTDSLIIWLSKNEKEIKAIADKAINARKAREAAKKAKDAVREVGSTKKNKLLNLPTKLIDAWSKDREKCELLICEGDSAANGLVKARIGEFQAVFPIRGKILNLYKATDEKTFANQEVVNIIKALGLELDPKTKKLVYDEKKLRYGKIILATDAGFSAV